MRTRRWLWVGLFAAAVAGGGLVAAVSRTGSDGDRGGDWGGDRTGTLPVASLQPSGALPDGGAAPHPLSRDAIAARDYQGSALKTEQDLGDRGGYRSKVVSWQSDRFRVRARDATPEERPAMWEEMVSHWPDYDAYQRRTEREIPVVVLERT